MDVTSPDEFIDKPVIDIDVTFCNAPAMGWTINDTPEAQFKSGACAITFTIVETGQEVSIERNAIAWSSITRRIDRIPVPKPRPDEKKVITG